MTEKIAQRISKEKFRGSDEVLVTWVNTESPRETNYKMIKNKLNIKLRPTEVADLDNLFQFQLNKEASYLAAFTPKDPTDKTAYLTKYTKLLSDPTVNNQTIVVDNVIVGSIAKFIMEGDTEITYWIDRDYSDEGFFRS